MGVAHLRGGGVLRSGARAPRRGASRESGGALIGRRATAKFGASRRHVAKDGALRVVRRRFNREFGLAHCFVIAGLDPEGAYRCYRCWVLKSGERLGTTYRIRIVESGKREELDPAARFVIESIEEGKG